MVGIGSRKMYFLKFKNKFINFLSLANKMRKIIFNFTMEDYFPFENQYFFRLKRKCGC